MKFKYYNKEKLLTKDFLNEMNKEFLSFLSKNRVFLFDPLGNKKETIKLKIYYKLIKDGKIFFNYEYCLINLDKGILLNDGKVILAYDDFKDYWEKLINEANYFYEKNYKNLDNREINNINEIIIDSLKIELFENRLKIKHKEKFYKNLHGDLIVVAWHPKRVVDWCYDIEEKEIYNSLPDE